MTPQQFRDSDEPYTFFMSVDPVTGDCNYEYLEGWDWSGYIQSIKDDFPERFHHVFQNRAARRLNLDAIGLGGLYDEK